MQKCDHGFAARAYFLERPAKAKIAAGGHEALFERRYRFLRSSGLLIDLGQIQVELGVIVSHAQSFLAESFAIGIALLSDRRKQTCVGKIERVFRGNPERAACG